MYSFHTKLQEANRSPPDVNGRLSKSLSEAETAVLSYGPGSVHVSGAQWDQVKGLGYIGTATYQYHGYEQGQILPGLEYQNLYFAIPEH